MADYALIDFDSLRKQALLTEEGRHIFEAEGSEALNEWVITKYASKTGYRSIGGGIYVSGNPTTSTFDEPIIVNTEFYPSESSGVKKTNEVLDILPNSDGSYTVLTWGTSISAPTSNVIYSVLNALGLSVRGAEALDEMTKKISYEVFGEEYTNKDYFFGVYKNGKTYIPAETIQGIADWLSKNGYYDEVIKQYDVPTTTGYTRMVFGGIGHEILSTAYSDMVSSNPIKFILSDIELQGMFNTFISELNSSAYHYNTIFARVVPSEEGREQYITLYASNVPNDYEIIELNNIKGISTTCRYKTLVCFSTGIDRVFRGDNTFFFPVKFYNEKVNVQPAGSTAWQITTSNLYTNTIITPVWKYEDVAVPMDDIIPPQYNIPVDVQYLDWNDDSETLNVPTGDDEPIRPYKYFPISFPSNNTQQTPNHTGDSEPQVIYKYYKDIQYIYPDDYSKVVEGNTGTTPSPIPSTNLAKSLYTIYNPSNVLLNLLGSYLWSNNFFDNVSKIMQSPIEAVISLQALYFPVPATDYEDVRLGNVVATRADGSNLQMPVVEEQYLELDLGYLEYPAKYANVHDYEPFTTTELYLPFIGMKQLLTSDVVQGRIHLIYRCEVTTGSCVCDVLVERDSVEQLKYEFTGNCGVQIPITGSSYARLIPSLMLGGTSMLIGGALAGSAMSGAVLNATGALSGGMMAYGSAGHMFNSLSNAMPVERTGNFSANTGAMCYKTPFLVITRKIPYEAEAYNDFYGYPSNERRVLRSCSGYTRVSTVHVENIKSATKEEKDMIERSLLSGVMILLSA